MTQISFSIKQNIIAFILYHYSSYFLPPLLTPFFLKTTKFQRNEDKVCLCKSVGERVICPGLLCLLLLHVMDSVLFLCEKNKTYQT